MNPLFLMGPPFYCICSIARSVRAGSLAVILALSCDAAAQTPELEANPEVATAGFYQLRWFAARPVELEEAENRAFTNAEVIYRGSDAARVMSGKPDGVYFYRVRDIDDRTLSNTVEVTVQHHSLARALAFFSVGAIVFVSTLLLIVTGARDGQSVR